MQADLGKVIECFRLVESAVQFLGGLDVLEAIKRNSPGTECVMLTAVNEARVAVECLRKGAYDYLVKPIAWENLLLVLNRALEHKRLLDILDIGKSKKLPELVHKKAFQSIVTRSQNVLRVLKEAELHAASDVPILIFGESGTGKELLARAIHAISPRSTFPFTPVNMASLTGSLFEAEFFGRVVMVEEDDLARLRKMLAMLPSREQDLIGLKYGSGLTNRAIANLTGLSETNVGTILYRVVNHLREHWE